MNVKKSLHIRLNDVFLADDEDAYTHFLFWMSAIELF